MFFDYVSLAFRNIKHRGIRSWLTMLGIFIGIAAVVSLISLGNGLQNAITGQFSQLGSDKLTISNAETSFGPPGATAIKSLTEHDLDVIRKVSGVEIAIPRLIRIVSLNYNKATKFKYIGSMPSDDKELRLIYDSMNVDPYQGRLLTKDDRKKVVLGHDFLLEDYNGKKIKLGGSINVQGEDFIVVGFLNAGNSFQINSVILMSEDDMKRILNITDSYDIILVKTTSSDITDATAKNIQKKMRQDRNKKVGEEDFSVSTPQASLQAINTILIIINIVVSGIAAVSLIVGGIGITNTMYTSILERRKEIGIMKAVGARNSDILTIFLVESSLLGMTGGIIGAIIGLCLAFLVSLGVNSAFPGLSFGVKLSPFVVIGSILFSLIVGTVSGIIPALQASRMRPVEALRA